MYNTIMQFLEKNNIKDANTVIEPHIQNVVAIRIIKTTSKWDEIYIKRLHYPKDDDELNFVLREVRKALEEYARLPEIDATIKAVYNCLTH